MDPNIPVRAWRLTYDHLDLINEDVAAFKDVDDRAREYCKLYGTLPVLGIEPPYVLVLAGFASEIDGTVWNESQQRYEPVAGTAAGDWLLKKMKEFRAESVIFKALDIDQIINVGMPQNTLVVAPDFSDLPILVMYGVWPHQDPEFGIDGLEEMTDTEVKLLTSWMQGGH